MPIDPARLNAMLDEQESLATRQTALAAPAVSPDDMAKAQRIAQSRNLPPLVVADNLADFDEQDRLDRVTSLAKEQPKLGAFLRDPERAALVKGEEEQLGLFGRTLGAWYQSPLNAPMRGLERSEVGASIESGATAMLSSLWHTLTDAVDQVAQRPVRTITDAVDLQDGEGRNPFADPLGMQTQADESLAVSREVKADQRAASERVGARPSFDDFVRDPNRAIEQLFAWAGNAGGQSVPQIALAVAARNPAAGGAIMGGTSGTQTFTDLRADGIDRFRAGEAAVQSGLFEAALGRAGLESATAPGARALLTGPLVEAGSEALTAAGQMEVDDLARQRRTPLAQKLSAVLDAGVLGLGFGIGEKGASSVLDVVAGSRPAQRRTAAVLTPVLRSLDNAARVTALTEQAAALKLGERSPQTVAAFVDQMGGGEVYLAADQARTLFQSERASADQMLGDMLGDPDALAMAEATGGDVVIPMAVYASAIARLPNAAEIAKHVRLHPEDYSAADIDGGKAEEELAALFGNSDEAAARANPEDGDAVERIRQDVLGQLQGANRYSPADAERQANLYAAIFRTLGQRTGMDAGALYDRYALRIRGSRPDILRQRPNQLTAETDALLTAARVGEVPSEADAFGPSLIEFLTERGIGAADGMDGELRRLAESERVGRGGQRRLFRADDPNALGLDRAREAAAEAGFLPADSSLSDFLELLERDISGQRVHSTANENRQLVDRRNEVLSLQEAMAEAFPDAAELEGLSNQDIADRLFGGAVLDQAALEAGPVVAGLTLLAQDDAAFQLPKSSAKDLEAIAAEVEGEGGITIKREPDLVTFAEEEGATDAYRITTPRGERGVVYESPDAVWIDVSALKQGGGGRRVYNIVANYAFNTGKVFIGDPAGLSDVAQARRLENMLSSALKFGTTRHLYPHAKQREGNATTLVPAIDWREGDDAFNLQQMAAASLTSLEAQFPEIVNLRYDPARDEIRDIATQAVLDRGSIDELAARTREDARRARNQGALAPAITGGGRSIERAVLAASLLRGTREEQSAILARLGGKRSARLAGTLYQSPQNPAAGGVFASGDPAETPEFRRWFGDSKVADADGRPLVVYHGTTGNIEQFDRSRLGENTGAESAKQGFFFTDDTVTAESYANFAATDARVAALLAEADAAEKRGDWDAYDAKIVDAEALEASFQDVDNRLAGQNVLPVYLSVQNPLVVDAKGENAVGFDIPAAIKKAMRGGHDGVIIRNLDDAAGLIDRDAGHYIVFRPEQIKSATANRGTFDPNDPSILNQQTAGAPRGQIDIAPDLRMSITLLEGADLSTFLHESGHFFLEVMADLAKDTPALLSDFDAALVWMGIEGETPAERAELWASMTLDERRPMHEQFARGFEAYLAEGKAPSVELASVFARFKAWMLAVYRSLAQLDVTLTDEVRGVFDRLLATDDEIALVEQRQGMAQPLVAASEFKTLGLTEAQWADYRNMLDAASEEARAEVFAKLYKAQRREAEAWWKEERAKVRAEVADEFEAEPIVRAWRILAGRKIEGLDPALVGLKLDRDSLLDTYAKEYVQTRLKPLGVYAVKGGVSADTAAAMLGLPSGDALVQGLSTAKERLARVEAETDARMRERHPDPMTDGSLPDLAERAVHNNARVKALQFELDLLAKLAGEPVPAARAIRRFAQQQIAERQIKGLRANDFLAAERRAARETTKAAAKGDFALALKHKRDQAVQAVLYAEARAALDQVEKHVAYARKFDKASTRSRIGKAGGDLLEMIDGILGVYAFRPQSDKARDRASTLRQWYDRMLAQGVQPQVDPKVLATIEASRLTHYRELTVGELSAVVELVKQLEHQASEANALRLAGDALELETEAENLSVAIMWGLEHRGPPPISNTLRQSPGEVSKKAGRMIAGALLRLRTLAHWVDGAGNVDGAFHRLIVRPLDRAQAAYLDAMADYGQKVIALFDAHMQGADLTAPIWIPSLNQNLTKADILAAALNTGNASNLQRLKEGMGWGDVQMTDVLRQMGEADWQFVQGVWDTLESLWPQIAEQQQRLTGVAPPKIDATPVQTPWGTLRGGYYPVMYDKDSPQWEGVFGKPDESLFDPMSITALPAQGHTKQRVDQARIPLKLDLAGIPSHLSNVLKDLTHRETLIGMRKLLARPDVVASLHSTLGPEASRFINDKLKHVATDQVYQFAGTMKAVANFSHGLRRHVGVMAMGYSVVTGLKQVLGFSTALEVLTERLGVVKAPRVLAKGYLEVLRGRGASVEAVRTLSGEMRHRLDTVDADVRNLYQQYLSGRMAQGVGAKAGRAYDAFRFHAFAIIRYAQGYLVDVPTWIAAHHAAQQKGLEGDAAVAFADDTLIASQGAGGAKDQALIEANIPGIELFTMFYSYANAYFNRQLTLGRDVGKSLQGGPAQFFAELPMLSARFAYLAVVPVILEELIAQAVGQSDGPDDDDDLASYFGLRMLAYQFYGLPILRDLVPKWAGTQKGAYRMSSAQSAMDSLGRLVSDIEKTVEGDAPEARKATRDIVMAAGYTFGLPLGGPWKHVDYLWRYFEGEEEPESVPEFAAALAAGKREQQ